MLKKKILIYNWVQFDKKDGGGVTVYVDNIINYMKDSDNIDLYFISSGTCYNLLNNKIYIKKTKNKYGNKVKSYTIYNSPIMFAYNQFSRVDIYNKEKQLADVFNQFIDENNGFDIIHFNNLEGLSPFVLKLKEKYPKTKFIYSMHNYFSICPNVYLWAHGKENCCNFKNGENCCDCIISNYDWSKRQLKLRTLLDKIGLDVQSKFIKNIYGRIRKNNVDGANVEFENKNCCGASDYKEFREINISFLNQYVDDILCVSKRVRDIAVKYGVFEEKCHVSYIGTKFANNLQKQDIDLNTDKFNLVYLGYMNKMKGFDFLVESLLGLDKKVQKKINLCLVCRNNLDYDINNIIMNLKEKFASVVYLDGYTHDNLKDILRGKHLGVIPVVWEDNLPQVSIEITSFGVPILASDLGGASELCESKNFRFKGGDINDFQRKLTNLVMHRERLSEFWKYYKKPKTMKNHLEELYEYYDIKEIK